MSDTTKERASAVLTITPRAAEKIKALREAEKVEADRWLRVGVTGGGCSGFTYFMDFDAAREDDHVVESDGVKVFVDPRSAMYLRGSQLDYVEGLMGAGFKIHNPNVKGTCGCGHSFEV
jgi:iron-sulfur cluster assembly accessory protein